MSICYTLSDLQLCERRRGRDAEAQAYIDELMELLPKQVKPVQEYANEKLEQGMTEPGAGQANAQD